MLLKFLHDRGPEILFVLIFMCILYTYIYFLAAIP